jgi:ABC-type nitrate/sulfonate/bicarbonate transport system substrate-binding protein
MTHHVAAPACSIYRLTIALLVSLLALLEAGPTYGQQAPVTITLSSGSFSSASLRAAEQLGIFAKHNLSVRLVVAESASAALAAVLGRSADVAVSGSGEALAARAHGQPIVIFGNVYRGLSSTIVISKAAADRANLKSDASLEDKLRVLDGLPIAVPAPTAVFAISLRLAAESVGAKIKMVYIGQAAMAAALESGAVQGMVAASPYWGPPVLREKAVVWISGRDLPHQFTTTSSGAFECTEEYAKANPETLRNLQAVLKDIAVLAKERSGEMQQALARVYPQLDEKLLRLSFDNEWKGWTSPAFTVEDIQHEIDVFKSLGQSAPQLDVDPRAILKYQ